MFFSKIALKLCSPKRVYSFKTNFTFNFGGNGVCVGQINAHEWHQISSAPLSSVHCFLFFRVVRLLHVQRQFHTCSLWQHFRVFLFLPHSLDPAKANPNRMLCPT